MPGPIALTARTLISKGVFKRFSVNVVTVSGRVAAVFHLSPSGEISTRYLDSNLVLLPSAGLQVIFAAVLVISNV